MHGNSNIKKVQFNYPAESMNVTHMQVLYILSLYDFDRFTRRRIIRRNILHL